LAFVGEITPERDGMKCEGKVRRVAIDARCKQTLDVW
jgi:hypothetical protein